MPEIHDAELHTVGTDQITLTFVCDEVVHSHVADQDVITQGPNHFVQVTGLTPNTTYQISVDGVDANELLPAEVTTLEQPAGKLLATITTVNDTHLGETECGKVGNYPDIGPIFRDEPGDTPFPIVMNSRAVEEMQAINPDVVIAKGDLTDSGQQEEFYQFLEVYGAFGDRLEYFRGNHDAFKNLDFLADLAPKWVQLNGVGLALLDTVTPGTDQGRLSTDQIAWLDDVLSQTSDPVMVFGHHQPWSPSSKVREEKYFGINPNDSEKLIDIFDRHENVVGYFAGHTHRNRVRRFEKARNIPIVEVACAKDYPGTWAEYRVYEHGYVQITHRLSSRDALRWSEKTRGMFFGLYRGFALGHLSDRCFTEHF